MEQAYVIAIVDRSGVPFEPEPTMQKEFHFVRFFHLATQRSMNLGYRSTKPFFVGDFVFKAKASFHENLADLECFLRLFGGDIGKRP